MQTAQMLVKQAGWTQQVLKTESFELMSFRPNRSQPLDVLVIYLEGDGYSWVGGRYPSDDPTPINPVALKLALAQPDGVAAYLARPCQFLNRQNGSRCSTRMWTQDRFSEEVIVSMNAGVDQIKQALDAKQVILVGYSGGARIALELAARRKDIKQVVTVAGNLDPLAWTNALGLLPLAAARSNSEVVRATQETPQLYLAGDQDIVVPVELIVQFVSLFPDGQQPALMVIEGNGHVCCWVEQWPKLWPELGRDQLRMQALAPGKISQNYKK